MQRKPKKPVRRGSTEWSELLDELERSGTDVKTFARAHGVAPSSLSWWRWKLGRGPKSSRSAPARGLQTPVLEFVPLVVERDQIVGEDASTRWMVETRSGLRVTMSGTGALDGLVAALRLLGADGDR